MPDVLWLVLLLANVALASVCFLKGRFYWGLIGLLLVPPASLIGAFLRPLPDSRWERSRKRRERRRRAAA